MNLKEFLNSKSRNAWIEEDGISIYVRRSSRLIKGVIFKTLDLCSIEAKKPGNGAWKRFFLLLFYMPLQEEFDFIFIENVINPRFFEWLCNQNFKPIFQPPALYGRENPCCYYKLPFNPITTESHNENST